MEIATSILSIKDNIEENIIKLSMTSTDYIHLDIMDFKFVPNKTNFLSIKELLLKINKSYDIHLMVYDIEKYIQEYKILNPKYMTFHLEATNSPITYINEIKKNCKVGISIKPITPVEKLIPYLDKVDLVLIMSVEPGYGGQPFIDITDKINWLREYRKTNNLSYKIEVDGGINNDVINKVRMCDIVVCGSYITNSLDYEEKIRSLR
jgi:ribulose-phosphate 3-epimerase